VDTKETVVLGRQQQRLNTVSPYYTMFPLRFPMEVLAEARSDARVLDPFCGRGTTLFAARALGLQSVGIDASPVATAIAQSKVASIDLDDVLRRIDDLLSADTSHVDLPSGEFWGWAYSAETLRDICSMREQLLSPRDDADVVVRAIALGILHGPLMKGMPTYFSNQMPRTYATKPNGAVSYWRARNMTPPVVDVRSAMMRRATFVLEDVPGRGMGRVLRGDSAKVLESIDETFDWIVTSPPYFGMRSYVPDQWLRNWFVGGSATVDYTATGQVRHTSLPNFTSDLAAIWKRVGERAESNARLVVRFGALPSAASVPAEQILRDSLEASGGVWTIDEVVPAGQPALRSRQAVQMKSRAGTYAEEIDLYATRR